MSRKLFLTLLVCLGLLEAGVLISGYLGRNKPTYPAVRPAVGPQDRALPFAINNSLPLYIEPAAGFTWLYTLVNNAKSTIDMTMYELVDTTFSADLVQACQRGVKVRVILDGRLEKTSNTAAYNQLSAAGPNCSVVWSSPKFQATHQKTILLDSNTAIVMTFNLASRYYAETRDMAAIDTDASDVNGIQTVFNKDFENTTIDPPMGHNLIWSPTSAQDDLVSLINGAQKTLTVENEELSAPTIVNAFAAACKRGVQVQLAMTDTSANYHANYTTLQNAGCGVHIGANNATTLYIHAKAIIADLGTANAVGYIGSINFSNASMTENRELGIYVHDTNALTEINTTITGDYNSFPAFSPNTRLANTQPALP